jgi:hypothetical protein
MTWTRNIVLRNGLAVEAAGKWRQKFIEWQLAPLRSGVPWSLKEKANMERILKKRMEIPKIIGITDYIAILYCHNK